MDDLSQAYYDSAKKAVEAFDRGMARLFEELNQSLMEARLRSDAQMINRLKQFKGETPAEPPPTPPKSPAPPKSPSPKSDYQQRAKGADPNCAYPNCDCQYATDEGKGDVIICQHLIPNEDPNDLEGLDKI